MVAQASVMIVAPDWAGDCQPIGTGFLVAIPGPGPGTAYEYVVTAAHVLRQNSNILVRVARLDGSVIDLPASGWVFHEDGETDVAVSSIRLDQGVHRFMMVPLVMFMDEHPVELHLGDVVYFIGLLAPITSMHNQNVPMVRSGTLGRLYQDDVRVQWPDGSRHTMTAHLIDCRSHSGFSGSPCYVQFDPRGRGGPDRQDTFLLGLITGHLDEMGVGPHHINSGVALVTPVEDIRYVLMQKELVEQRELWASQWRRDHPEPLPAVIDFVPAGLATSETAD
jgi:hypothetical protein